ncbi:MAG: hypothetical protein AB7O79_07850 [Xanthobacteraceae bacterium]
MNFRVIFRIYVSAALLAFCFAGSQARADDLPTYFPTEKPEPISKQAFASPYFAALLEEFAKQVEKRGDASCLRSKALDGKAIQERARRILVRHGEEMIRLMQTNIDERLFRQYGGAETLGEIQRLEKNPAFTEFVKLARIGQIQTIVDWVVTSFNHFVVVNGYDWQGFSGVETGNPALLKFYDEPADRMDKLLNDNASLHSYLDLREKLRKETKAALHASVADRPSHTFFKGAEKDVAELCLVKK